MNPIDTARSPALSALILTTAIVFGVSRLEAQVPGACLIDDAVFNTQDGGCKDLQGNTVWSFFDTGNKFAVTFDFAASYCADLVEAGFDDWRLPTKGELETLMANNPLNQATTTWSYINLGVPGWRFWSSNKKGARQWVVANDTGQASAVWRASSTLGVICARGGSTGGKGGGKGGGKRNSAESSSQSSSGNGVQASHRIVGGSWRIVVSGRRYAGKRYVLVAGLPQQRPAPSSMRYRGPVVVVSAGPVHTFDSKGIARVRLELLGLPVLTRRAWRLSMLVLDPRRPRGIAGVVPLIAPKHRSVPQRHVSGTSLSQQ